jgi:hypothetical protein
VNTSPQLPGFYVFLGSGLRDIDIDNYHYVLVTRMRGALSFTTNLIALLCAV